MREKLAASLAEVNTIEAEVVENPDTTLTPVEATWLSDWQVFDVQLMAVPHSYRFYAALSEKGTALILSGSPDSFVTMTRSAGVVVDDDSLATDVAVFYLDVTRGFARYSYRIDAVADIDWLPEPDADAQQQRADLEAEYGDLVGPPAAEPAGAGWTVTVWMVDDRALVRHLLTVGADGAVEDRPEVVEADIPVPWTF
ncbi:MAG: hypothetical protein FWD11_02345 [Micrococcales bacterium]|nr:hypothetical protein [Micrococcales bacterium]